MFERKEIIMSIQLTVPPKRELKPRITVIGVGGAGGNAVNNMITAGLELSLIHISEPTRPYYIT